MEETGCDQGEAELALNAANYDLEVAVKTIGSILRNFDVFKAKFIVEEASLFGLLLVIINTKRKELQRVRAVISYNPVLFEIQLEQNWFEFEKHIYGFRLGDGVIQSSTQELERYMAKFLLVSEETLPDLKSYLPELLSGYFHSKLTWQTLQEGINLEEYHKLRYTYEHTDDSSGYDNTHIKFDSGHLGNTLSVLVQLQEESEGKAAKDLLPGDTVYPVIVDQRDTAQYLARLLGGRMGDKLLPLPTPIESITDTDNRLKMHVRFASGIIGVADVEPGITLRVKSRTNDSWWKQFLPRLS